MQMRNLRKIDSRRSNVFAARAVANKRVNGYYIETNDHEIGNNALSDIYGLERDAKINSKIAPYLFELAESLPNGKTYSGDNASFYIGYSLTDYDPSTGDIQVSVSFYDYFKKTPKGGFPNWYASSRFSSSSGRFNGSFGYVIHGNMNSNFTNITLSQSDLSTFKSMIEDAISQHDDLYNRVFDNAGKQSYDYDRYYSYEDAEDLEYQMGMDYSDALNDLVLNGIPNVVDFVDEGSTQAGVGSVFDYITFDDGRQVVMEFDYSTQMDTIYEMGPKKAARKYFNEIKRRLKSGEYEEV